MSGFVSIFVYIRLILIIDSRNSTVLAHTHRRKKHQKRRQSRLFLHLPYKVFRFLLTVKGAQVSLEHAWAEHKVTSRVLRTAHTDFVTAAAQMLVEYRPAQEN